MEKKESDTFDTWNEQKKGLRGASQKVFFRERDVLYARLGKNVGFEQNGKGDDFRRPVLVLRKFNKRMAMVIPLTSVCKEDIFHFGFESRGRMSYAILSQMRLIDADRFSHKIGAISFKDLEVLKKSLKVLLKL